MKQFNRSVRIVGVVVTFVLFANLGAIGGGANSGQSQEFLMLGAPMPEPTTLIAGALLILPFGLSTLRFVKRNRE